MRQIKTTLSRGAALLLFASCLPFVVRDAVADPAVDGQAAQVHRQWDAYADPQAAAPDDLCTYCEDYRSHERPVQAAGKPDDRIGDIAETQPGDADQ
jgi:hypothetical protein